MADRGDTRQGGNTCGLASPRTAWSRCADAVIRDPAGGLPDDPGAFDRGWKPSAYRSWFMARATGLIAMVMHTLVGLGSYSPNGAHGLKPTFV